MAPLDGFFDRVLTPDPDIYRDLAPVYDFVYSQLGAYGSQAELVRRVLPEDARIAELGCASGRLLGRLDAYPSVGVDASPAMLALAADRTDRVVRGDIREPPLAGAFDAVVLLGGTIAEFTTDEGVMSVLRGARSVLGGGGSILVDASRIGPFDPPEDTVSELSDGRFTVEVAWRAEGVDSDPALADNEVTYRIRDADTGRERTTVVTHRDRRFGERELTSLLADAGFGRAVVRHSGRQFRVVADAT